MQLPAAIRSQKAKTDLCGYICLCAEIGLHTISLALVAALKGITVQAMPP